MAAYGLDVDCPRIFYGTHFARWKNWMICNFKFIFPQMWWMVDVGFSHVLGENNLTQAQEKCLDIDIQATNIMYRYLDDCIFGEIINMKTAHDIWIHLNEKYGMVSNDDDEPKKEAHEDVEHSHNSVIVEHCSTSWSMMMMINPLQVQLTRLIMMPQVMQMMMLLHAHLLMMMMMMMDMRVMSLQAHPLHHIASCHKVTLRYLMQ
jgi:hypothetical protein